MTVRARIGPARLAFACGCVSAMTSALAALACGCGGRVEGETVDRTTPGTYGDPRSDDAGAIPDGAITQPLDRRLVPLELGRSWTFEVTPSAPDATPRGCSYGTNVARVVGASSVSGEAALRYRALCTPFDVDVVEHAGRDETFAYAASGQGEWILIDEPVENGHAWSSGGLHVVWRDAGTVTVRAGTFEDCWSRDTVDAVPASSVVYCRGVGQVRFSVPSDGYDAELVAKSF